MFLQLTDKERCTHHIQNIQIVGDVSFHSKTITLTGNITGEERSVIIKWKLEEETVVQTSALQAGSGSGESSALWFTSITSFSSTPVSSAAERFFCRQKSKYVTVTLLS